jgi:Dockerin type I domain
MKGMTRKVLPTLLMTLLLVSSTLVLLGQAQPSYTGSLLVAPNPVGVNQVVSGLAVTDPPTSGVDCTITVKKPDGSFESPIECTTDSRGVASFTYTPMAVGSYDIDLLLPGDEFTSATVELTVQELAVPPAVPVVPGDDVTVYPDAQDLRISLHFEHITSSGSAAVSQTPEPPEGVTPLQGILTDYFDFSVTFTFSGMVTVGLPYDEAGLTRPESRLTMWHYEGGLVGDVNADGKVDLKDLLLVARAMGSTASTRRWNSACDLNGDGKISFIDLFLVLRNLGKTTGTWVDVTSYVDTVNNIVYGTASSFPPFGIRYR